MNLKTLLLTTAVYRQVSSKTRSLTPALQNFQNTTNLMTELKEILYIKGSDYLELRKSNYQQKPFGSCLEMPLPETYVKQEQIRPCCPARDDKCFYLPVEGRGEECFCDEFCMLNGDCCSDYYDVCMWIYEDNLDEPREVLIDTNKPNQLLMLAQMPQ